MGFIRSKSEELEFLKKEIKELKRQRIAAEKRMMAEDFPEIQFLKKEIKELERQRLDLEKRMMAEER